MWSKGILLFLLSHRAVAVSPDATCDSSTTASSFLPSVTCSREHVSQSLSALAPCKPRDKVLKVPWPWQIGVKKRIPAEDCPIKTRNGDNLHMHYTGTLYEDGSEFDSSIPRGQPLTFQLGTGRVIKGWDQGLVGMCEGEKRKLIIPPELGYGASGSPPKIPGNSVLVFEVELVKIERKGEL